MKRMRLRLEKAEEKVEVGVLGDKASVQNLSQSTPVLSEEVSGLGILDDRLYRVEERKDVGIGVDQYEDDVNPDTAGLAPGSAGVKPKNRVSTATRMSRSDESRFRSYDECIEGVGERSEVAFPDDLELQFEIPSEVEEIEV